MSYRKVQYAVAGPTPESLAKAGTEESEQVALFCWAALPETRNHYPELQWMFAIPNGGLRNKIIAAKLKAQGVKAGVLDIFLPVPRGNFHGLFIELKRGATANHRRGYLDPDQKRWIEGMRALGYGAICCIGWIDASHIIIQYLESK